MNIDDMTVLQTSKDPDALCEAALQIASQKNPEALRVLGERIGDEAFLGLLDSEQDYHSSPETLNVSGVLETLGGNPDPSAQNILVQLTQDQVFSAMLSRVEMLILACADIRPVPARILTFWTLQTGPDSSSNPLVVEALFTNGTAPAMTLFETMMTDPSYPTSDKIFWLLTYAVPHRDDPCFLEAAERVIKTNADQEMTIEWIRIIFDYQVTWYPPMDMPKPPNPIAISPEGKELLLKIGNNALALENLPASLKSAIETRLKMYRETEKQ
ncbi:MAG: hypothetical protein QNK29_16370 [Desulfobacterales bacterium]|nr:hypothetical protein [Desulfobacterales bacterium]MDX2513537.1 hypothetical protein [Desulfobacterales bacterium]